LVRLKLLILRYFLEMVMLMVCYQNHLSQQFQHYYRHRRQNHR
jgi:hypothetical protein